MIPQQTLRLPPSALIRKARQSVCYYVFFCVDIVWDQFDVVDHTEPEHLSDPAHVGHVRATTAEDIVVHLEVVCVDSSSSLILSLL